MRRRTPAFPIRIPSPVPAAVQASAPTVARRLTPTVARHFAPTVARRPAGAHAYALALAAVLALATFAPAAAQGRPSFYEPGISPDGREIAFVSGGDIWTVPVTGGAARLLVSHSAHESRPLYSPDGSMLAFNSNRSGNADIYILELATGTLRRLTHDSGNEELTGWSADSRWVYFASSSEDVSGMSDVFRVRATGGTPMAVAADRYETEFAAAPSPTEAGLIAIASRGRMAQGQWWRNGSAHIDQSEIWTVREATRSGAAPVYTQVTAGGKNLWPMWGASGSILFMSDRSGTENLWSVAHTGGNATQLTSFSDGRVLWPSATPDGRMVAFERDFGIWTLDVASRTARPVDIRLMGAVEAPTPALQRETQGWSGIAVAPDGRKWAFLAGGDVWATTMDGGVPATRVTETDAAEGDVTWSADSRYIVYTSWRSGTPKLYAYDFTTGSERQLTTGNGRDGSPTFSPDGRHLAYTRLADEQRELRVLAWPSGADRRLALNVVSAPTWSPDSRWLAYGGETGNYNNIMVVPVTESGPPRQVSFVANTNLGAIQWSAKGDYIVYRTSQRTEPNRLVKIDMVPLAPTFDEDRFRDLFNQPRDTTDAPSRTQPDPSRPQQDTARQDAPRTQTPAQRDTLGPVPRPTRIDIAFDGIRRRGGFVNTSFSVGQVLLSPDGRTAVVSGDGALHRITFGANGNVDINRLDATGNPIAFSSNARQLYVSQGGQLRVLNMPAGNQPRTVSTSVAYTEDFDATKVAAFEQGWGEMRDGFYDPEFHGVNWPAVRDRFRPYMEGARTRAEFNRLMNLMLGELNASHLGHSGRTGPPAGGDNASTGRLGLRFDRIAYETDGRFVVTEVVELGPAHVAGGIAVGDRIVAVDGVALDGSSDLDRLLRDRSGREVVLSVRTGNAQPRNVQVLATSGGAERQLVYRNWVESRRAYVDSISGGRLGYVHIASMSEGALEQLIFDLDQQNKMKDGVVVDVRNNNGGFVNVYAIDILARRNYFTMQNRGSSVLTPSRVQLGQRALLAPTVLVTNRNTLSDGEDFTEGYRELGLGTVVGEPTAGWIIFTGSRSLVDGTSIRMPGTFIRDNRGQNMELNPRPVDIEVQRPAGEWYSGRDSQLDRAVEVLLRQIAGG
ncbi:MAG TPA: S41 family peptidase [Longimicrobiales bacterium]|nr:S41 family peptidase [Longimicrobiales bacterium]